MSTNYYVVTKPFCEHCGAEIQKVHIGKSSAGWVFQLHAIPELGIHKLDDWIKFWDKLPILDEYDRPITKDQMLETITKRVARSGTLMRTDGQKGRSLPTYEMVYGEFS